MKRLRPQRIAAHVAALVAVALIAVACSSGVGAGAPAAAGSSGSAEGGPTPAPVTGSAGAAGRIDPCQKLTTADVQPFFSVPIVTQLPGPIPDDCEWSANDSPGSVSTALDVRILTGQDALDWWTQGTFGGGQTNFDGVGDKAEHLPGVTDLVAIKGDVACGLTTFGYAHLAGKMAYQPGPIPDADATRIAQQYGTLCNRIFGSGETTPTMTAAPVSAAAASAAAYSPAVPIPAGAGTLGPGVPLPAGVDCSGGKTSTDSDGSTVCDTTATGDPRGIYPFYLSLLPKDGFVIHHQQEEVSNGKEIASILFGGNGVGDLSAISVIGTSVVITLQKP